MTVLHLVYDLFLFLLRKSILEDSKLSGQLWSLHHFFDLMRLEFGCLISHVYKNYDKQFECKEDFASMFIGIIWTSVSLL